MRVFEILVRHWCAGVLLCYEHERLPLFNHDHSIRLPWYELRRGSFTVSHYIDVQITRLTIDLILKLTTNYEIHSIYSYLGEEVWMYRGIHGDSSRKKLPCGGVIKNVDPITVIRVRVIIENRAGI